MRTLLIIGLGDIARRALPSLVHHWRVMALVRSPRSAHVARTWGALPVMADLDDADSLQRLSGLADDILITAPPPASGKTDPRMRKLLYALAKGNRIPQRICYISTTGVYGNGHGQWLDEQSSPVPQSDRAWRRLDAELSLRAFAKTHGTQLTILRAPGIYAMDRLPLSRLFNATPLIVPAQDSYSNHIHADDLARLCVTSLLSHRGGIRIYNACDNEPMGITEWYSLLANALSLPLPPQLPRDEVAQQVSPGLWSYMAESRRIRNDRLAELGFVLQHPTVRGLVAELAANPLLRAEVLAKAAQIR